MQQEPANGEPATERTEVRIVFDAGRLILGVTCFDSDARYILGNELQRDQSFTADDRFMITIDTYADGRSGYYFEINAAGAVADGLIALTSGTATVSRSWDGIWDARVVRGDDGWTAEIELPFRTLNFDANATAWGINFQRTLRRTNEEMLWSGWARNQGLTFMSAAGRLVGLTNLSQGLGLDIRPYVTGSTSNAPGRGAPDVISRGAAGADVFYSLTPALRANLTINTDFAETEVDQRQVNLTRFPLFFPEKRAFFLEGSNFFEFAREGNAIMPFFSRRIGLDEEGVPQPISYGTKLTGQLGAYDIGALHVGTRDSRSLEDERFTVIRGQRRFLSQSSVGGIFTHRTGQDGRVRHTAGADLDLQTARFLGSRVLEFSSWVASTTPRPGADAGHAYGMRLIYPNNPLEMEIFAREVQDGYDPAVGFVNRRAYRQISPDLRVRINSNARVVRRVTIEVLDDLIYDLDGRLESRQTDIQLFRMEFQSADLIGFHLMPSYERLPDDFTIASGVVLPAGSSYDFVRRLYQLQTAARRAVGITVRYEDGAFYSGTRRQIAGTLSVRPYRGWLIDLSADLNRVGLREGSFNTRVWRADVNSHMSPWISLVNRLQYDTITRGLGWQARFRWILRPGNDVYFVYTRNWRDLERWSALDQKAAAKIVTTYRF